MDDPKRHDFDPETDWCRRCGMGAQDALAVNQFECAATENVVAISHLVRGQILRRAVIGIRG